jgi:KDO2-lipid IV(A) lauroyltransferase
MGGVPVPKNDILRYLVKYKRAGVMTIFGYIADQGPRYDNIHLWLPFLNHDTGVFTGAERIMRKMQNAVFYVEMSRPRRGYYTCTYHLMTSEPQALPEYELTRRFFQLLEEQIRRQPEFYLWSHNRWKRTHQEYERMIQSGEIRR